MCRFCKRIFAVLCACVFSYMLAARNNIQITKNLDISTKTGVTLSSGLNAPFWLTSNRQGLSTTDRNSCFLDGKLQGGFCFNDSWRIDYGTELAVAAGFERIFNIQQLYADFSWKWLTLSFGSKERWGEFKNIELSSGGLTWSGNSRPVPQIRLEVPEFAAFAGGWLALKGHVSYGLYTDSKYRLQFDQVPLMGTDIKYHSKAAFIRIGNNEKFPLNFIFGLEMYSQWGGYENNNQTGTKIKDLPGGFDAAMQILLPFNKVGKQTMENGNSLGSWHFIFTWTESDWKAKLYYEHFYEDHSSMLGIEYKNNLAGKRQFVTYGFRQDFADGLWGIELTAPKSWPVNNFVFEFLNTKGQCGSVLNYPNPDLQEEVSGRDSYYAHGSYRSYTHWGYGMGNPLILSPVYNQDGTLDYRSDRIIAFHIGVDGTVGQQVDWKILASHTRSWGTYHYPLSEVESTTMLLAGLSYRFGVSDCWKASMEIGADFDSDSYLGNNGGVMFTLSRKFNLL